MRCHWTPAGWGAAAVLFSALAAKGEDWPQFLGPHRDGSTTNRISPGWGATGPQKLWSRPIGHGFSGPILSSGIGLVFYRENDQEVLEAFDPSTGVPRWRRSTPTSYVDDFGFDDGPRGTPAVESGRVFTFGAEGRLSCVQIRDGKPVWEVDAKTKLNADKGFFGMACSPLVAHGLVLVNLGGRRGAGVAAFKMDTGELAWSATDDEAGYASPIAYHQGETDWILFFTRAGLRAIEPANGKVALEFPWRSRLMASVNAASPLVRGDEAFLTASYDTGGVLLKLGAEGPRVVWRGNDSISAHYATPVLFEGHLYGFHGRQEEHPDFRCIEWATGKVKWTVEHLGAGTVGLAADHLVLLLESGELVVAKASPAAFSPVSRSQILGELRAPFALGDGLLLARDKRRLAAFDTAAR